MNRIMLHFPAPKMSPKSLLSKKEAYDFCSWKQYVLLFNRVTKNDRDDDLDSNVLFEISVAIKPKYDKTLTPFSDLIDLLLSTKKETTISFDDQPERFICHYFDEVTIYPLGRLARETPPAYGDVFMANWKTNFVAVEEMSIDINLSRAPREHSKDKLYFPNAFGIEDLRFRHILDCFRIYNDLCPSHAISSRNITYIYKRLNFVQNELFDMKNPDYKTNFNFEQDKHRYWIPPEDVVLKKLTPGKIEKVIAAFNENWALLEEMESAYKTYGHGWRYCSSPALDYIRELLRVYGDFLRKYEIASYCLNCDYYFHFRKGKKFCSLSSDGRNCGKSYRNQRDYMKHKDGRRKRAQEYMRSYRKLLSDKGVRK